MLSNLHCISQWCYGAGLPNWKVDTTGSFFCKQQSCLMWELHAHLNILTGLWALKLTTSGEP